MKRRDEELELLARDCLKIAVDHFVALDELVEGKEFMRASLRALRDVNALAKARHKIVNEGVTDPDEKTYLWIDARSIVATALWYVTEDVEESVGLDEISPYSKAGERICGFIQACLAMSAASELEALLDDDMTQFGDDLAGGIVDRLERISSK